MWAPFWAHKHHVVATHGLLTLANPLFTPMANKFLSFPMQNMIGMPFNNLALRGRHIAKNIHIAIFFQNVAIE